MINWVRPSGTSIQLQDTPNMTAYAESNGWRREGENSATKSEEKLNPIEFLINEMNSKEAVIEYAASLGCSFDKRGNIDIIKDKAIKAIAAMTEAE